MKKCCLEAARRTAATLFVLIAGWACPANAQPVPQATGSPPPPGSALVDGPQLTLDEAVKQAFTRSPSIREAEARLDVTRGQRTTAGTYPHNPELRGRAASRRGPNANAVDFQVLLRQRIEIAGQRHDRVEAARAAMEAERARLLRSKRMLAAQVHLAFVAALEARELLEVAGKDTELTRRLYRVARRRLERGAGTQLDVNVAAAELGRAGARYQSARAAYLAARAELAEVIGLEPAALPRPRGPLLESLDELPSLGPIVASAREHRADLLALRKIEAARVAEHELARSEAWPDLTLAAFGGREEGTDTLFGGMLTIPLPVFDRNQGRRQETSAAVERARAEHASGELSVEREVVAAHARYEAGVQTAARLRQLVFGTLEENIELLQRSFEAGKATWPEVVMIRRTLVDAERELTSVEANARRAWVELQIASGRMPLGGVSRGKSAR